MAKKGDDDAHNPKSIGQFFDPKTKEFEKKEFKKDENKDNLTEATQAAAAHNLVKPPLEADDNAKIDLAGEDERENIVEAGAAAAANPDNNYATATDLTAEGYETATELDDDDEPDPQSGPGR